MSDTLRLGHMGLLGGGAPFVEPARASLARLGRMQADPRNVLYVEHVLDRGVVGVVTSLVTGVATVGVMAAAALVGVSIGLVGKALGTGRWTDGYWAGFSRAFSLGMAPVVVAAGLTEVARGTLLCASRPLLAVPQDVGRVFGNAVTFILDPLRPERTVPAARCFEAAASDMAMA